MPQLTSYHRPFGLPGDRAFTSGNLIARLPMGMFSVSAVVMIAGTRGSYALAGAVTATGLAATAVVAPWTARLVDRHGQVRVALPATVIAVLGSLALLLCVHRLRLDPVRLLRRHRNDPEHRRHVLGPLVVPTGRRRQGAAHRQLLRGPGPPPAPLSYALSGKRPISAETRRRVEAAVRELGYRPQSGAPAHGGSKVLAVAGPLRTGVHVPATTRVTRPVVTAALGYDHDVALLTHEEGLTHLREPAPADALVLMDIGLHDPRLPLLRSLNRPSVPARPARRSARFDLRGLGLQGGRRGVRAPPGPARPPNGAPGRLATGGLPPQDRLGPPPGRGLHGRGRPPRAGFVGAPRRAGPGRGPPHRGPAAARTPRPDGRGRPQRPPCWNPWSRPSSSSASASPRTCRSRLSAPTSLPRSRRSPCRPQSWAPERWNS